MYLGIHDLSLSQTLPASVLFLNGFAVFWYHTLDAVDGKQARRTDNTGCALALLCERAASGSAHPVLYLSACELGRPQQDSPAAWDLTARALHSGARCVIASTWNLLCAYVVDTARRLISP